MPSFVEHAIAISRKHASATLGHLGDPRLLMSLAAHAYAIACLIPAKIGTGTLTLDPSQIPKFKTLQQGVEELAGLSPRVEVGELYALLIEILSLIEQELVQYPALWDELPLSTPLKEEGPCSLSRHVVHRFLGPNALKTLHRERLNLEGSEKDLPPPILQPPPHPSLQLDRLRIHWNSDPQMPDVVLASPEGEKPLLVTKSGQDFLQGGFRLLLCPLAGPFNPQFQVLNNGRQFRARDGDSISGQEDLLRFLTSVIAAAREKDVHLVVFPELMICQGVRRHLVDLLKGDELATCPYGVLAGSFHVWREASNGRNDYVANESVLFDHVGRPLLRHDKRGKFGVPPKVARGPNKFFPVPATIPAGVKEVVEGIEHREDILEFLETSLGRIAVAICADCIVQNPTSLQPALERAQPDLLLIAAMTSETTRFEIEMAALAERGTTSALVNAHCICPPPKPAQSIEDVETTTAEANHDKNPTKAPPLLAAVQIALFEPTGAPPTRIQWQSGAPEPEVSYLRPKDLNKAWRPISKVPENCGAEALHVEGTPAGLIVEFGVHAKWKPAPR